MLNAQHWENLDDGKRVRLHPRPSVPYVELSRAQVDDLAKFMDGTLVANAPAPAPGHNPHSTKIQSEEPRPEPRNEESTARILAHWAAGHFLQNKQCNQAD